ncbi:hypothetical protein [Macrococcus animalis]|uniref:hypothetical protein n=1 Tax=Macrococcus animalis TaxID=3395467 RepID=UPI0039BE5BA6
MKKILLALLITLLAISAILDTKNYVLGNKFDITKLYDISGDFDSYNDAVNVMETNLTDTNLDLSSSSNRIYKLPNNHYYILQMFNTFYRKSDYLYTGLIEIKNANETELTVPAEKLKLIEVNGEFENDVWKVNSKAGQFDFKVGQFGDVDEDEGDKQMMDDNGKKGLSISLTPKKGVVEIGRDGIWFDNQKKKVGMTYEMNAFNTESEAIKAVKKDDFGKVIGVIKSDFMNFHIFKSSIDVINEYTIIPVRRDGNQFKSGKFERFSYMSDDIVDIDLKEEVEGVHYRVRLQQDNEKFEKMNNQIKDGKMHIAVEVRGEENAE